MCKQQHNLFGASIQAANGTPLLLHLRTIQVRANKYLHT